MAGWSGHAWDEWCFWCGKKIPAEEWHWHHGGESVRCSQDETEIAFHEACLPKIRDRINMDLLMLAQ